MVKNGAREMDPSKRNLKNLRQFEKAHAEPVMTSSSSEDDMDIVKDRNAERMKYRKRPKGKKQTTFPKTPPNICLSDTSCGLPLCVPPRNPGRKFDELVPKIVDVTESNRAGEKDQFFLHGNIQKILYCSWGMAHYKRMVDFLEGNQIEELEPSDFHRLKILNELQRIYGPQDVSSKQSKKMVRELQRHLFEVSMGMLQSEMALNGKMAEFHQHDFGFELWKSEMISQFNEVRFILEMGLASFPEIQMDLNPYTSKNSMDFWVMPRPPTDISVYTLCARELEKSLVESRSCMPFLREGYNAAVFDVGWYCYPLKVYPNAPKMKFFEGDPSRVKWFNVKKNDEFVYWNDHLLKLREKLRNQYYPWGVEMKHFARHFQEDEDDEDEPIFGEIKHEEGLEWLKDLFYCQKLDERLILFDALLEGQIVTPKEMMFRLWTQVRTLIELQPNQSLVLKQMKKKYKLLFNQDLFSVQWGFSSPEAFIEYCRETFSSDPSTVGLRLTKDKTTDKAIVQVIQLEKDEEDPWSKLMDWVDDDKNKQSTHDREKEANLLLEYYEHDFDCEWM